MSILGINAVYHDSAACLVEDGRVLAAAEEERFTRIKHGKRPVPFSTYELPFKVDSLCQWRFVDHHVAHAASAFLARPRPYAPGRERCNWPWSGAYISCQGYAMPCCLVSTPDHIHFGNMAEQGVTTIWNSVPFQTFHDRLASGELPEICLHVRSMQAHFENERELMEGSEMLTNRASPEQTEIHRADTESVWLPAVANQSVVPFWLPNAGHVLESGSLTNTGSFMLPVRNRKISLTPLPETLLLAREEEGSRRALPDLPPATPLRLDAFTCRILLELQGPSLGLWRAAEIAALREQSFERPILDVGCGDGLVTSLALSAVDVGLDPDERTLARAARLGLYEQFECAPVEEPRLADASFATVISNSVLEHLPRVDEALAAIARLLQPRGKFVLTAPTEAFSRWLTLPVERYAAWRNHKLAHLNLWSTEQWRQHLEAVGLEVEMVRPYLRRELVMLWDALELLQQVWIGRRRLPPRLLDRLALLLARLDLSAQAPGGGRLIVARKRG